MTSSKRLDQTEPILADVVQKVDRLIAGNGQIIAEVSKIPAIERTVAMTARGLADLTTTVNTRFDKPEGDVTQLQQIVTGVKQDVTQLQQGMSQMKQDVTDLKSGQQLILQILREKLP